MCGMFTGFQSRKCFMAFFTSNRGGKIDKMSIVIEVIQEFNNKEDSNRSHK